MSPGLDENALREGRRKKGKEEKGEEDVQEGEMEERKQGSKSSRIAEWREIERGTSSGKKGERSKQVKVSVEGMMVALS